MQKIKTKKKRKEDEKYKFHIYYDSRNWNHSWNWNHIIEFNVLYDLSSVPPVSVISLNVIFLMPMFIWCSHSIYTIPIFSMKSVP